LAGFIPGRGDILSVKQEFQVTVRAQTMSNQSRASRRGTFGASFKSGLLGGFAISLLLVVNQVSPGLLQTVLIPPALLIVWVVTGIGAAMLCDDKVKTSRDGGRVGLVAGIIAGIFGGITAMIIAAFGGSFLSYGEGILSQLSDTQMASLTAMGFNDPLIALSGSILSALFTCGFGGMFISALLGSVGGWLYPKFSR
jgi:hypothetical protein